MRKNFSSWVICLLLISLSAVSVEPFLTIMNVFCARKRARNFNTVVFSGSTEVSDLELGKPNSALGADVDMLACAEDRTTFIRFTSLALRKMYLFELVDDRLEDQTPVSIFESGASLILCLPISEDSNNQKRFIFSNENKIVPDGSNVLGIIKIEEGRDHYTIPDIEGGSKSELFALRRSCPLAPDLVKRFLMEKSFDESYIKKNGYDHSFYF